MLLHKRSLAVAAIAILLTACGDEGGSSKATADESSSKPPAQNASESAPEPRVDVEALTAKGYVIGDVTLGDASAPVTIIEYASLTCPACKAFHEGTLPTFKKEYIETGKVKLIMRELHGAEIGLQAAALARCDGPDRFYAFLDVLFSRQDNYRTQDPAANVAELKRIGKIGGLSAERIDACLTDTGYLTALYQESVRNIEKDKVPATPYLIIQPGPDEKTVRGAMGSEALAEIVDGFLKDGSN